MLKRTIIALIAVVMALFAFIGCTQAKAETKVNTWPEFKYVHDWSEPKVPSGAVRIVQEQAEKAAQQEPEQEEPYTEYVKYYDTGSYTVMGNPDGLNSFDGVYEYNGKTESFYASHAIYDDQLTVDDDGFFRDDQGRYVVATDDYAQGTEIEISQGKAIVMDGGTEPGVIDVHTTWGR